MTCKDPLGLYNGYTKLKSFLIFDTRPGHNGVAGMRGAGCRCGGRADEVGGVNLNLVAPLRTHLSKGHLRVLKQDVVFYRAEADGYSRGVCHGVCTNAQYIGRVDTSSGAKDELKGVLRVKLETRDLGGGIAQRRRDGRDALAITVEVEGAKLCSGKFKLRPLERDGSLGDITKLRRMRHGRTAMKNERTSSLGFSGVCVPNASNISLCRFQKSFSRFFSSEMFRWTEMLTIEPVETPGGSSNDGNSMR